MYKCTQKQETIIISVLLLLILLFGAFMRLWHIGYSSYWIDESFTLMQARGISQYGYPLLDSGYMEWKDLLIPYIVSPIIKIFGFEQAWLLRLPSAIFGILSIFVGYHLAVNLFSRYTALLFAFFIAVNHWYIAWSQQVRGYAALIFFVLLFFYFLSLHDRTKMLRYIFYAFITIVFALLAKKFGILLFLPFLSYLFLQKQYKVFTLFAIPALVISALVLQTVMPSLILNKLGYFQFYVQGYLWSYFNIFLILAVIGYCCMIFYNKKYLQIHASILLFFFLSIVGVSLFLIVSERRYLLMITPFLFLYTAFFIDFLAQKSGKWRPFVEVGLFLIVIFFAVVFQKGIILVPQHHYGLEYYTPQPNYNRAYNAIRENGFDADDIIISANPSLDIIYLGHTDYVIPWSLTGRGDMNNIRQEREFYSGSRKLYGKNKKTAIDKIHSLQQNQNVYIVFDALAQKRIKFNIWDDITEEGENIFVDGDTSRVFVYKFSCTSCKQ